MYIFLPRAKTNPPSTINARNANDPTVLATMIFLPNAAMKRNTAEAIW